MQQRTHKENWIRVAVGLTLLIGLMIGQANAGGIAGTIRDVNTNQPLVGIDLDVFDANFNTVTGVNASTDSQGNYLLSPLPAGDYYLRADPSLSEGYVDQYYPGVFLKSEALPIAVSDFGTEVVDFYLEEGGTISGRLRDAVTLAPIPNTDLDIYAWDGSYISSVNARSDSLGIYTLGCLPPGNFFVRADPDTTQWYVRAYYNGKQTLSTADPIYVSGVVAVVNINFNLILGGTVGGTIRSAANGLPLSGIDLDVFDAAGNFVAMADATTDLTGGYKINPIAPGTYYVQADPSAAQGFVDTYYGDVFDFGFAVPITVTQLNHTAAIDINLPLGGTISGLVTNAQTGLPVGGVRLTMFDGLGSILVGAGASTNADGTFLVGAVPTGDYLLRCNGDDLQELAFQFYPGAVLKSLAQPIAVTAGMDSPGFTFSLNRGGWIAGTIRAEDTGLPMETIDMDVYSIDGEFVGALDAKSAADGTFLLGPCPFWNFVIQADPTALYDYQIQYFDHVPALAQATPIQVTPGQLVGQVNYDLLWQDPAGADDALPGRAGVLRIRPNPMTGGTATVSFSLSHAQQIRLTLHDVTGRRIAVLADGRFGEGQHEIAWSATDLGQSRHAGSAVLLLRLEMEDRVVRHKILTLR